MNDRFDRRILECLGLLSLAFGAGLLAIVLAYGRGEYDGGYELGARFPTAAQGLFTDGGTEVKLRGVTVGTVSGVELLPDAQVQVTLDIDDGIEVPVATRARIEPLSIFGPKFVDLIPVGPGDGPVLADGDQLIDASTGSDLTDVLEGATGLFAAVDPAELVTIFDAVAAAVGGLGDTMGSTIDDGATLVGVAHRARDRIGPFVADAEQLSTELSARSERILGRIEDFEAIAELVAGRGDELSVLLDGTARIATTTDGLVRDVAADFDVTVRSLGAVLEGVHDERELIPSAFDTVGAFFDMLGAGMRLPGPDGKKLTALKGFVTADLCLVFGVCLLPDGGVTALEQPRLAGSSTLPTPAGPVPPVLSVFVQRLVGPLSIGEAR